MISKWLPQATDTKKKKKGGLNSINFTDAELKLGGVVAGSHPQHIF